MLLAAAPGLAGAQLPPPRLPLHPIFDPVVGLLVPAAEDETGQDLHGEDIRIDMFVDVRNADQQVLGILFGGGNLAIDARALLHIEFRGVLASRLDDALRAASGDANVTLNGTFGFPASRVALTAEEIRLAGAGVVLRAFQDYEARASKAFLERTLPGIEVTGFDVAWSHYRPGEWLQQAPPRPPMDPRDLPDAVARSPALQVREPPLVLDADVRLHYQERVSLVQLLSHKLGADPSPESLLKDRLRREQGEDLMHSRAFTLLGYSQLLQLTIPPGWLLNATIQVPRGFTLEGATSELELSADHRSLSFALDGTASQRQAERPALATLSSRFPVTLTALVAVALAGYALRLPLETAALWWAARRHRARTSAQT